MRLFGIFWLCSCLCAFSSCIGDDVIFDTVEESIRITTMLDTLGVGDQVQFEAIYTNNIGQEEPADILWESSDPEIFSVDQNGLITGLAEGPALLMAIVMSANKLVADTASFVVAENTVISAPTTRTGALKTTSSYILEGNFELAIDEEDLVLSLDGGYRASSSLPGLYIYLTNNPASTNGAYEIGAVDVFSGAHAYRIPQSEVGLNQYTHVLYFCKPFNVKVGDGKFDN